MRSAVLILCVALSGCGRHALPLRKDQLAAVSRAVAACTDASGALTPYLRRQDRAGADNAAIAARNLCSSSRAEIVAAIGTGTMLDACYFSVDRQEAVQRAELADLDMPTLATGQAVARLLDDAIRQQAGCATALDTAARGS